jgi:hypothetical protein
MEVTAYIAGSHEFRRTASAKSLFLLLRVIIKFSKVRAIFKGQEMRMMLEKKMKETKPKVHFIVGNDIQRSDYLLQVI